MNKNVNPSIINRILAESNVGSPDIQHAHHLRRVPKPAEALTDKAPVHEIVEAGTIEESPLLAGEKTPRRERLKLLFRAARRGIRGEEYGSAET